MNSRRAVLAIVLVVLVVTTGLFLRRGSSLAQSGSVRAIVATSASPGPTVAAPRAPDTSPAAAIPARYRLFSREVLVLARRDGAPNAAGEFERLWLIDSGDDLGRVRVIERVRRNPAGASETVLKSEAFVAGDVLATAKSGATPEQLATAFTAAGAVSWKQLPGSPHWVAKFPAPDLDTLPRALAAIAGRSEVVQAVEGNGVGTGGAVPNDPQFINQFSLRNTGQLSGTLGADIRMAAAWDQVSASPAVIVAVIDSGLDFNHPDLTDNAYRDTVDLAGNGVDEDGNGFVDDNRGWDFVNNDNDPTDDHNHGSHVAGTIGARGNNGVGIAGVSWNVRLLTVKVLNATNGGTTVNMIAGVNYARGKGAKIMNLSLINYPFSQVMADAVTAANNAGILLTISAGNSGTNNDATPNYPSSHTNPNIISVLNTTNLDQLNTGFSPSNYGATTVHLGAPGSNIVSTVRNGQYSYFYGTSQAAPHVAGVAALLLAVRPTATPAQLKAWILDTADRLPALSGRCVTGARLNADAALRAAGGTTTPVVAAFTTQPQAQTTTTGGSVTFTTAATGTGPLTYQWYHNDFAISGATSASYVITNAQAANAGTYKVTVTNPGGTITSSNVALVVNAPAANPGRIINLSVLTSIAASGDSFTLGYVVGGAGTTGAKPLVIRTAGPSLGALGVPGTLINPRQELFAGATKTGENDDWGGGPVVSAAMAAVGAFPYTSTDSRDSATLASITTRDNSVRVSGVGTNTGTVIAEVYDATPNGTFSATTPRLLNVSVLKHIGAGLTVGFVIGPPGATGKSVVIRAVGPTLNTAFGITGVVANPQLVLFRGSTRVTSNDDWGGLTGDSATFTSVGAFALPPTSQDAALRATLNPGDYSVVVTGVGGTSGIALVEVYEIP